METSQFADVSQHPAGWRGRRRRSRRRPISFLPSRVHSTRASVRAGKNRYRERILAVGLCGRPHLSISCRIPVHVARCRGTRSAGTRVPAPELRSVPPKMGPRGAAVAPRGAPDRDRSSDAKSDQTCEGQCGREACFWLGRGFSSSWCVNNLCPAAVDCRCVSAETTPSPSFRGMCKMTPVLILIVTPKRFWFDNAFQILFSKYANVHDVSKPPSLTPPSAFFSCENSHSYVNLSSHLSTKFFPWAKFANSDDPGHICWRMLHFIFHPNLTHFPPITNLPTKSYLLRSFLKQPHKILYIFSIINLPRKVLYKILRWRKTFLIQQVIPCRYNKHIAFLSWSSII